MNKKITSVLALCLLFVSVLFVGNNISITNIGTNGIEYNALVCKKLLTSTGEVIADLGCDSNVITEDGLNHIKHLLGAGVSSDAVKYIALGNGTAPTNTSTTLDSEITNCGLSRAGGTYTSNGVGNWTIQNTFTSTCDNVPVNTTALFNATTNGIIFAGDTFTTINMQSSYQIQLAWTLWTREG